MPRHKRTNLSAAWSWRLASVVLLVAWPAGVGAKDEESPDRPYSAGPLTAADFRGERPATARTLAWTEWDYRYSYRYTYATRDGVVTMKLSEFKAWAVVRRDKCWNLRPDDAALLDHEQGHFDLAQIHALESEVFFRKSLGTPAGLQTRAASEKAARAELEKRLAEEFKAFTEAGQKANVAYDKETAGGDSVRAQAAARKQHRQRLEALHAELKTLDE